MVGADFRLHDIHLFPLAKLAEDFPDFGLLLPEKDLPTEFGSEYYMIFAVPRCMSQRVMVFAILHLNLLVALFCRMPVRISNVTKSFFHQGRNASRLFGTTCLAGGFLFIQKSPR
jgi:hypothetical protein